VEITGRVVLILLGEKLTLSDPVEKAWKKCQTAMNNPQ
jgi:hypothetical protein